jgi:hypothetical protein
VNYAPRDAAFHFLQPGPTCPSIAFGKRWSVIAEHALLVRYRRKRAGSFDKLRASGAFHQFLSKNYCLNLGRRAIFCPVVQKHRI